MDPFIRTALDRATLVREIYRRVANVQHPDTWHPISVICPNCGKVGTTIVTDWDGETVAFECRPDLVDLGARLRRRRAGSRRSAAAPSCPGTSTGPPSGRCSASRSSPAARTSPRPVARATGRDAIAREVFEREPPLNVPYEFLNIGGKKMSTLQGPRRRRARDRRGRAARAAALPVPAPPARTTRSSSTPRAPTRSRACSTSSTSSPPRPPAARSRASCRRATRRTFRYSLVDPDADVAAEAAALPAGVRATSRCSSRSPASTSWSAWPRRRAAPLDRPRAGASSTSGSRRRAPGSSTYAPDRRGSRSSATRCPPRSPSSTTAQRAFLGAARRARAARARRPAAMPGRR